MRGFIAALPALLLCAGCHPSGGATSFRADGAVFEYDSGTGRLSCSMDPNLDREGILIPTRNFAYWLEGGRKYGLNGQEIRFDPRDKRSTWQFSDTVVLSPGDAFSVDAPPRRGAQLIVDVPSAYSSEVQAYYAYARISLWTGRGTLR